VQRTLCLMARLFDIEATDADIAIHFSAPAGDVLAAYRNVLARPPSPEVLAQAMSSKWVRKFDEFVAEPLLVEALARDAINLEEACQVVHNTLVKK